MGFAFLDKYDVQACANLCNSRGADGNGGACQYFNIWRAVVRGDPTTYSCSMVRFFLVLPDGSFELITNPAVLRSRGRLDRRQHWSGRSESNVLPRLPPQIRPG